MLGVLKRRWKPKRSPGGSKIPDTNSLDGYDKSNRNAHQVHPVLDSQALLVGYEKPSPPPPLPSADDSITPPPLPPPLVQQQQQQCYPLTPNICVEAGRIQFIKAEPTVEGVQQTPGRVTVTRGQQTDVQQFDEFEYERNISLKNRIAELEQALELAQKNELRDKQTITKLQKSLNRREATQRDADRERRLRSDSEIRAKQALQEAARYRSRLKLLTNEFARMEETVRSMLMYKKQAEQLRQEKAALTLAFENRCKQYQVTISRLNLEITTLHQQLQEETTNPEGILQAQTEALHRHAEESRKQYERCLDDVANQVVRALLAQKGLKEEVVTLNNKIHELEGQNRALTLMLVHQLRGDTSPLSPLDLDVMPKNEDPPPSSSSTTSPTIVLNANNLKHCNSFNSDVLEENNCTKNELVVSGIDNNNTRLSLEDKKRHQVLTKLWTDLKGTEVTPKKLLEALSAVDSTLWVPPKRPVSLNLQLPILQATKYRPPPVLTQSSSKSEEEVTGNESPESGNRDEGYSTMSSDVQADVTRGSGDATLPRRDLEDLKEASDETDMADTTRLLVTDNKDPDILYIPLNLLNLKQRNSYPPGKDILPFQHIMRSFSDSHLCIKITTAPSPCYTFSSPISSSPSFFLFDITDKGFNPLRVTKRNCDDKTSQLSWSSTTEERLECTTWDAEYIQRWLRLDETRSTLQQQHRDMLELEYDRAELEDWSLSLSTDDLREHWKKIDTTPSQISISTLPSIQENNQLELEEDANECLWNNSSYMADKEGRELVTLLMDGTTNNEKQQQWPYAIVQQNQQQISPDNSWSSAGSDEHETCSKRSSVALSGSSDDTNEMPAIGTDFTRDFYRLVKFESTKSLASISSRSVCETSETNNILSFIVEQNNTNELNNSRTNSMNEITKEFNIEGPPQQPNDMKLSDSEVNLLKRDIIIKTSSSCSDSSENYVTLKQLCDEFNNSMEKIEKKEQQQPTITYADEVCLVTALDVVDSENCSNISEHPVDICSSVNVEISSIDYQTTSLLNQHDESSLNDSISDISASTTNCTTSDSLTSSLSTTDTIVSKIPLRKTSSKTKIPTSTCSSPQKTGLNNNNYNNHKDYSLETKIPKYNNKAKLKKIVHVHQNNPPTHVITAERLPQSSSGVISSIIEGPPHRAVSFHERATSKDVIDELNRMIKNGDGEQQQQQTNEDCENGAIKLDEACKPTGWVHVERDVDLNDPKARANLLDVMMATVSSDSSPTSSCGGSVASDSTEDPPDYGQLHRIHKFHRQKKANAVRPEMAVVRASMPTTRPTIIGRPDFYVRYGEKEREAVASFDFLDDFSTASSSLNCSMDEEIDENTTSRRYKVSQV